jgi:hypothetical protein
MGFCALSLSCAAIDGGDGSLLANCAQYEEAARNQFDSFCCDVRGLSCSNEMIARRPVPDSGVGPDLRASSDDGHGTGCRLVSFSSNLRTAEDHLDTADGALPKDVSGPDANTLDQNTRSQRGVICPIRSVIQSLR